MNEGIASPFSKYGYIACRTGQRFRYDHRAGMNFIRSGRSPVPLRIIVERLVPEKLREQGFILVGQSVDGSYVYGLKMILHDLYDFSAQTMLYDVNLNFVKIENLIFKFSVLADDVVAGMSLNNELYVLAVRHSDELLNISFLSFELNIKFVLDMSMFDNCFLVKAKGSKGRRMVVMKNYIAMVVYDSDNNLKIFYVYLEKKMDSLPHFLDAKKQIRPPCAARTLMMISTTEPVYSDKPIDNVFIGYRMQSLEESIQLAIKAAIGGEFDYSVRDAGVDIIEIVERTKIKLMCYHLIDVVFKNSLTTERYYLRITAVTAVELNVIATTCIYKVFVDKKYRSIADYHKNVYQHFFPDNYQLPYALYNANLKGPPVQSIMPADNQRGFEYVFQFTEKEKHYPLVTQNEFHIVMG